MVRYAIYFAPRADSTLWTFGSSAIGYDAVTGEDKPFPDHDFYASPEAPAWTEEPRRYGFHATLKAPFSLRDGASEAGLMKSLEALAAECAPIPDARLKLSAIGRFLALTPVTREAEINALAAECVRRFEPFRAPISDADRARRLVSPLTARQRDYLDQFGYPYVLDEFRFHMTLTGPLEQPVRDRAAEALRALYQPIDSPVAIDAICLFRQQQRNGRFVIVGRSELTGRAPV
ncbi:DUF1045 domain-containing protein [Terrarubrum flagellatum]|uniref:DUF1045 domain-containing protein n=1 Tax=Terrirubrum flagellatum TaxID=2895980 RepID=UPI0031452946